MTNTPVRVGIIGAGAVGSGIARAFAANPETPVTYIVDTNAEQAATLATELKAPRWATDYQEMLAGDFVDMVYVGVPPKLHHRIALEVMAAGKHILCEKPLAINVKEAHEMAEAAAQAGVVNAVQFPLPRHGGTRTFKQRVAEGYLGDLRRIDVKLQYTTWPREWQQNPWIATREQGGPVREVTPHIFQVILDNFGPILRVRADMDYPADPTRCETGAFGVLELANGRFATVNVLTSIARPEETTFTAYGTEGTLQLREYVNPYGAKGLDELQAIEASLPTIRTSDLMLNAIRTGDKTELIDFATGLQVQQVLEAWERSAVSGQWERV